MPSALNVEAITFIPAIPGTTMSRWAWSVSAPMISRKTSGSTKPKNAAVGLRQNCLRSRRNWRQPKVNASDTDRLLGFLGGQLEIDVLEARARDSELPQRASARQRLRRQVVQQLRRIVDLALLQ